LRILVSNDDGVLAPGLLALVSALSTIAQVTVVAPESERSGASSALTLDRPLHPVQLANGFWAVNGFPADCVYVGLNGLFQEPFDLVISGINSGANMGDDVLYSGTIGAAFEGRGLALPAIAVSLVGVHAQQYRDASAFKVAAEWVRDFVKQGIPRLPAGHIFNINIPDIAQLSDVEVTRMGVRDVSQPVHSEIDPRGRQMYWVGKSGDPLGQEHIVNDSALHPLNNHFEANATVQFRTDFAALNDDFVSITPIRLDATGYSALVGLKETLFLRG
jgi:5'-nucleotidase